MKTIQYPIVVQNTVNDCGACALLMIYRYYGGNITLKEIKKLLNIKEEGTSFQQLKEASSMLHLEATCYHADMDHVKKLHSPFIAHVKKGEYYHYVVIYKVRKNQFLLADPATGFVTWISSSDFSIIFLNHIMLFEKKRSFPKRKGTSILPLFFKTNKRLFFLFFFVSIFSILLESIFSLSFYFLMKTSTIYLLICFLLFFFVLSIIKDKWMQYQNQLLIRIESKLEVFLRKRTLLDILKLPYRDIALSDTGSFTMKLERVEEIVAFLIQVFVVLFLYLPFFLLLICILLMRYPRMLIVCIPLLLLSFFCFLLGKKEKYVYASLEEEHAMLKEKEVFTIKHRKEIYEQNLQMGTERKLSSAYQKYVQKRNQYLCKINQFEFLETLSIDGSTLLMMGICIAVSMQKGFSFPECFLLYTLLQMLLETMKKGMMVWMDYAKIKYYLSEYVEEKEEEKKEEPMKDLLLQNAKVEGIGMLRNISIQIKEHDKVLLKGKSGIGKTTLAHVLCGDYEVFPKQQVGKKERICYVSAESMIENGSLQENLTWGRIQSTSLEDLVKLTHIEEICQKESKMQTLSSGEKQKISLCRALMQEFDMLILDEALNQVSEEEEIQIMEGILTYFKEKQILVISHRSNLDTLPLRQYTITCHGQLKKERRKKDV